MIGVKISTRTCTPMPLELYGRSGQFWRQRRSGNFWGAKQELSGVVKQECLLKKSIKVLLRLFKGAFFGVILELNVYFLIKGVS